MATEDWTPWNSSFLSPLCLHPSFDLRVLWQIKIVSWRCLRWSGDYPTKKSHEWREFHCRRWSFHLSAMASIWVLLSYFVNKLNGTIIVCSFGLCIWRIVKRQQLLPNTFISVYLSAKSIEFFLTSNLIQKRERNLCFVKKSAPCKFSSTFFKKNKSCNYPNWLGYKKTSVDIQFEKRLHITT
jgi:hypothetical protein